MKHASALTLTLSIMTLALVNCAPSSHSEDLGEGIDEVSEISQESLEGLNEISESSVSEKTVEKPVPPTKPTPKPSDEERSIVQKCIDLGAKKFPKLVQAQVKCSEIANAQRDKFLDPIQDGFDKSKATKEELAELYAAQEKSIVIYNTALKKCYAAEGVKLEEFKKFNAYINTCIDKATR